MKDNYLLILGDFNASTFQNPRLYDTNTRFMNGRDETLLNFIHANNLTSLNSIRNIKNSTLDLVLTSTCTLQLLRVSFPS